ncbi:Dynein light chain 1 cytoplasmic [Taenia crassiceps]|uniref:Dynein light chain n=1 Tax=Taenia crassiceps TaxID=6207 RepID=A0ABR4Q1H4_9CEST
MNTICRCNPDPMSCASKPHFVRMDLDEKVESYFLHIVYEACQCYTDPVDLCTAIKQCLDQKFGPMWHVVVGPEFGSHFEHEPKGFCYITYQGLSFLMFKFG